jgi:uncharacterized membrane protein
VSHWEGGEGDHDDDDDDEEEEEEEGWVMMGRVMMMRGRRRRMDVMMIMMMLMIMMMMMIMMMRVVASVGANRYWRFDGSLCGQELGVPAGGGDEADRDGEVPPQGQGHGRDHR